MGKCMRRRKVRVGDVVVILGVGKHKQVDYSSLKKYRPNYPAFIRELSKNGYQNNIGSVGRVTGTGGLPYHWVMTSEEHNMFLHLDSSEIEVIGTTD
jgi:hypothetical protein